MYVRVLNCQSDQLKWTVMVAKFIVGLKFNKRDSEGRQPTIFHMNIVRKFNLLRAFYRGP